MQDKIRDIESLYKSQLYSLNIWREQALKAVYLEYSLSLQPILQPLQKIYSLNWKESESMLKETYKILIKENIIDDQDYEVHFLPHFYEGQVIVSEIKCKNKYKAVWAFYILGQISVMTNEYLHNVLPQHCSNMQGKYFTPYTIKTYLSRIRKAKQAPAFIRDLLFIFPLKSLPKSLLKM